MLASDQSVELARLAAQAASAKHATDLVAFDVSGRLPFADVFLIVSGANERQVGGIVDGVEEAMFRAGQKVKRREGESEARWVLLDFGDLVVHVQHEESRMHYSLERLWRDSPMVELGLEE